MILLDLNPNLSIIFYNFVVSFSVIVGGYLAYDKFIRRHENSSLIIKIINIKIINDKVNCRNFLLAEVLIHNNGQRELMLYHDYKPNAEKVKSDEEENKHYKSEMNIYISNIKNNLEKIGNKIGLTTGGNKQYTGRLRSGARINLPFLFNIDRPGIYLIEHAIDVNMTRYYKGKDYNDQSIKTWHDRRYFQIKEEDLVFA